MTTWLLSNPASLPVIDGLIAFYITGNAVSVLMALCARLLRRPPSPFQAKDHHHA